MKEYQLKIRVPLGAFSETVEKLEASVNESLLKSGWTETLSITSVIPMKLNAGRKLSGEEVQTITKIVEQEFAGKFGTATVLSFDLLTPDTREECDHNYPVENGWSIHQPQHCSNCGQDL